jgi:hypothetical protein
LVNEFGEDLWPALREEMEGWRAGLDSACAAALAGPIRFNLNAGRGHDLLLPHLSAGKTLAQVLGARTLADLRAGDRAAAWTNVLAATRLVTAWEPEPVEVSHLVRFACAGIVYNIIWQGLQADGWTDQQLAQLQAEWEAADFLKGAPEVAAYERACWVGACLQERQQPVPPGMTVSQMARSPRDALYEMAGRTQQARYRALGTYEDERGLLLHYRDRELQFRRASQASSWSEMRTLRGVTNTMEFQSKHSSSLRSRMLLKQVTLGAQGRGVPFLGKAAEAETRRRLILTAIALERRRGRQGSYPKTLRELFPEGAANPGIDFMDGQPLRYRLTPDGHFVLYSVGLDGVDQGGVAANQRQAWDPTAFGTPQAVDLVWPRPATPAEVKAQEKEMEESRQRPRPRRF